MCFRTNLSGAVKWQLLFFEASYLLNWLGKGISIIIIIIIEPNRALLHCIPYHTPFFNLEYNSPNHSHSYSAIATAAAPDHPTSIPNLEQFHTNNFIARSVSFLFLVQLLINNNCQLSTSYISINQLDPNEHGQGVEQAQVFSLTSIALQVPLM